MPLDWCVAPALIFSAALIMSFDTLTRLASTNPQWMREVSGLDDRFRSELKGLGMLVPHVWAHLLKPDDDERGKLETILGALGLLGDEDEENTERLDAGLELCHLAAGICRNWAESTARVSNLQVSMDAFENAKRARTERFSSEMARLATPAMLAVPTVWRGKAYRRAETAANPRAREEAEENERRTYGTKVVRLLVEAGLPFGKEVLQRGWAHDSPQAFRCLRGLRGSTLRRRLSDWEPFRRWLHAHEAKSFPDTAREVLCFFEAKQAGKAARTSYDSLLLALSFLEECGEQPEEARLGKAQGLRNAAKEASTRTALEARKEGRSADKKQAPPLLLGLLGPLEKAVLDESRPTFQRAYAWYRLLRHWASLRYHDTSGMPPATLSKRTRGLYGVLERTKTSGADKGTTQLPVFVSEDAWVDRPWLWEGLALWEEHLAYPRDYLLPLPTRDLEGTCHKRARYTDARAFSHSLLASLRTESGSPLLLPEALGFWTEHSDRCGVDSWLAALGVPRDLRSFVGRWGVKESTDTYVRTSVRITENLQRLAARHAQTSRAHGPDFFGEEHLLCQLASYLREREVPEDAIRAQIARLQVADQSLPPTPFGSASPTGAVLFDAPAALEEAAADAAGAAEAPGAAAEVLPIEDEQAEAEIHQALLQLADEDAKQLPLGYVISIAQRGRFRTVHWRGADGGGCKRIPGEHYHEWRELGDRAPEPHEFTGRCHHCFPADAPAVREAEAAEVSSVGSQTSSDSADEADLLDHEGSAADAAA